MKRIILRGSRSEVIAQLAENFIQRGVRKTPETARIYAAELFDAGLKGFVTGRKNCEVIIQ